MIKVSLRYYYYSVYCSLVTDFGDGDFLIDFSKNIITTETLSLLFDLAKEVCCQFYNPKPALINRASVMLLESVMPCFEATKLTRNYLMLRAVIYLKICCVQN